MKTSSEMNASAIFKQYSPYSMWGQGYLGGELHYWGGEEAALTAAKVYIQRDPGNVHVHAWVWLCMHGCGCVCIEIKKSMCT